MTPAAPTPHQIEEIAAELGLELAPDDAETYRELLRPLLASFSDLDALSPGLPEVKYARTPGRRPSPEENPLGAWYVRTHIEGAASGPLAGRSVALKDNMMLAGVPMMNGTSTLEGYVPDVDATIAARILDAGGIIAGKAVCEAYCFSGGSHTSATGPVHNPRRHGFSAGGSSSGSAALVAAGDVDMAIGCDQGGSIRIPSSFCGTYGLKPTHGLVPYTGILGFDPIIDHAGPITASVADNALLLEVLAGPDGLDSRQYTPRTEPWVEALGQGIEGIRIGLLREGFGLEGSEPDVDEKVRGAATRLERLGAKLSEVSAPLHPLGQTVLISLVQSMVDAVFHTDGCPIGRTDPIVPSYLEFHRGWRQRTNELPETIRFYLILTEHLRRQYGYRYYAKGLNRVRELRAGYDAALRECDLLLLPTTPSKARALPPPDASLPVIFGETLPSIANTAPFDVTHHPAMSIPCGLSDGLPIGLMLVGRHGEESTIYRAAHAFEQHDDWESL